MNPVFSSRFSFLPRTDGLGVVILKKETNSVMRPDVIIVLFMAFGLSTVLADDPLLVARKLEPMSSWGGSTLFEPVPGESIGVEMGYDLDLSHRMKRLYAYGWATGNCAIGDVNGDGKMDLFFPGTTTRHRLFVQTDGFRFEDVTDVARVGERQDVWGSAAIMGDVDRDGDVDIYVVNFDSPNQLFLNIGKNGQVRFIDMAEDYGVNIVSGCLGASFVDYNGDGWLDLFVQTYHHEPEEGRPDSIEVREEEGVPRLEPEWEKSYLAYFTGEQEKRWVEAGLSDLLFVNNRKGQFVIPESGIAPGRSYGASHVWWDMDNDQRADLYTGNDSHGPDLFYRQDRNARFVEIRGSAPCTPWFSRGAVAADLNNDLAIDFLGTSHAPLTRWDRLRYGEPFPADILRNLSSGGSIQVHRNVLLSNTGTSRFEEIARMAGLADTGAVWAVKAGDYDCDGRVDLFFATGEARDWTSLPAGELAGEALVGKTRWDLLESQPPMPQRDLVYRNLGNWQFEEVGKAWGLDHEGMSYCVSQGDLDGDGDIDLVVNRLGEGVTIYRNHCREPRMIFEFEGDKANTEGVGVEMLALLGDQGVMRQLYPTGGFKSSDRPAIHLGLGNAPRVDRVTFRWPGTRDEGTFDDLQPGFHYRIKEGSNRRPAVVRIKREPIFRGSTTLKGIGYTERPFVASSYQPMLPEALTLPGPGLAASDLDGDGLSELYLSGSANAKGKFISPTPAIMSLSQPFTIAAVCEETAPVFFDADSDGDLDLYLGDGGVEYGDQDFVLWDRLFLNRGDGRFVLAPKGALPGDREITGAVAAADFDRDGDVDLYVGSRMKKRSYPDSGKSALLRNEGDATFVDATSETAPGLGETGMVTGAIWTDANGDGWVDLLLTHDWGPPRLWMNREGVLEDATESTGLSGLTGRWNGVTGRDVDNDGDIDYLLSNRGTNTGFAPARVYREEVPGSEAPVVLFAAEEDGRWLPTDGWSNWGAFESIMEKAPTPRQFADGIGELTKWEQPVASVVELRTGMLINDGTGSFSFRPLPWGAQVAPVYGAVLSDFNFDGRCDAFVIQNDSPPSTTNPDPGNGGISRLFLGSGNAAEPFSQVGPDESGLVLFGYGRSAIVTDLNSDNRPDLICSMNSVDPAVYLNFESEKVFQPLKVQLDFSGKLVGSARVTVEIPGFVTQTAEYHAGGGYLSQSPSDLFFGAPANPGGPAKVTIRWADGTSTTRRYYLAD